MNGTKWIYVKVYRGSPLLVEKYWPKSDISYRGKQYTGIVLNYNVYNNELIIYHAEKGREKYVVVSSDFFSGFSFQDTVWNRIHNFEYTELPGTRGKSLYEKADLNNTKLYIKPIKKIETRSSIKGPGEFINYYEYYLGAGNQFHVFHSKKQLIKLLGTHGIELSRFIRKNKLKINPSNPENVIAALRCFEASY